MNEWNNTTSVTPAKFTITINHILIVRNISFFTNCNINYNDVNFNSLTGDYFYNNYD